jgi:hypothetical protein
VELRGILKNRKKWREPLQKGEVKMEFKAYTMNELEALADAKMDEWLKTRRIGVAEYDPDLNVIKLHVYSGNNAYQVDLDRCKTKDDLLNWVFHLMGKRWCKGAFLTDFFQCLEWTIREKEDQNLWQFFKVK